MLTTDTFMLNSATELVMISNGLNERLNAKSYACNKHRQEGAVLIVGLILLMVITLLALAGIQGVSLQGRMSGNAYDRNIAFNAAEIGLRWAENRLLNEDDSVFNRIYTAADAAAAPATLADAAFESGNGNWDTDLSGKIPGISGNTPQVTVIALENNCFKVNSRGKGRDRKTEVVLQSVVCRD